MSGTATWVLRPGDPGYPSCIGDLGERPAPRFHGVGDVAALTDLGHEASATIVGSRRASSYGLRVAETLARELSLAGVTIVSGMALGIDAAAHRGALAAGGRTVAVLAGGPDVVYPSSHGALYERIVAEGAVVSEFAPGTAPQKRFFPARNRIMAALGGIAIIVEAAQPSGSLITADVAAKLGRAVGAVPGRIGARNAEGTNGLIKDGAHLIRHTQDVLDLLFGVGHPGHPAVRPRLEPPLDRIFDLVTAGVGSLDRLAQEAALEPQEVAVALSHLELLGLLECDPVAGYAPTGINSI